MNKINATQQSSQSSRNMSKNMENLDKQNSERL